MKITINTQPKADEDVFKAGTLVKSAKGVILVTNKSQYSGTLFCGVVIEHEDFCPGDYSDAWDKSCFVKFIGNVLLEQEA